MGNLLFSSGSSTFVVSLFSRRYWVKVSHHQEANQGRCQIDIIHKSIKLILSIDYIQMEGPTSGQA